jgi:hypothetical protein
MSQCCGAAFLFVLCSLNFEVLLLDFLHLFAVGCRPNFELLAVDYFARNAAQMLCCELVMFIMKLSYINHKCFVVSLLYIMITIWCRNAAQMLYCCHFPGILLICVIGRVFRANPDPDPNYRVPELSGLNLFRDFSGVISGTRIRLNPKNPTRTIRVTRTPSVTAFSILALKVDGC